MTDSISLTNPLSAPPPDRPNRVLAVLRAAWLLLAAGLLFFYGWGLLLLLRQPLTPCFGASVCTPTEANAYLQHLGLSPGVVNALVFVAVAMVIPLACLAVAAFIIWRADPSALSLATATTLLVYGLLIGSDVTSTGLRQLGLEAAVMGPGLALFAFALTYVLHTFPNGRFVPRWSRLALLAEWLVLGVLAARAGLEDTAAAVALLGIMIITVGLQVYRYRRVATPTERQQIKWGLTGLLGFLFNSVLWLAWVLPVTARGAAGVWVYFVFVPISLVLVLSLPVTLAIAVLRYRLWDIDVLIRRTLIYAGVTAVLTATYFCLVVGLQAVAVALTSQRSSALVTVLSTLAIAALFAPLRRRVQDFVDRRFYRRKYDTAQTLAAFAQQARSEVDLDALAGELRGAVTDAMQPSHVDLWLR